MKGYATDDPYKYYDEVCLFSSGEKDPQGFPISPKSVVANKARYKEFELMEIRPCVHYRMNTDEDVYRKSYENGA